MSPDRSPTELDSLSKTSGQQTFQRPHRRRTWGRRRSSQVVVLVTSSESLYLADEGSLDECSKPLKTIPLPRTPWINSQDVYVRDKDTDEQYVGTVKVNRIGRGMTWKRFIGSVKEMYVYDRPPRASTRTRSMIPA